MEGFRELRSKHPSAFGRFPSALLLSKADRGTMQQKSHDRNVLQQACDAPGDAKALRCLCEKARLITFTKEYHKTHREKLKRDAKKAFDELYQKARA